MNNSYNQHNTFFEPLSYPFCHIIIGIEQECYHNPWTINHFIYEINNPHSFSFVLLNEKRDICGYAINHHLFDQLFILNIAVAKKFQGKGFAHQMFRYLFEYSSKKDIKYIDLEVRISNCIAQKLYKKNGFEIIGERRHFYSDGETALLMHKQLKS